MAINEIINTICDCSFYVSTWIPLSQNSDIWSNISLDVAMKVFFLNMRLTLKLVDSECSKLLSMT